MANAVQKFDVLQLQQPSSLTVCSKNNNIQEQELTYMFLYIYIPQFYSNCLKLGNPTDVLFTSEPDNNGMYGAIKVGTAKIESNSYPTKDDCINAFKKRYRGTEDAVPGLLYTGCIIETNDNTIDNEVRNLLVAVGNANHPDKPVKMSAEIESGIVNGIGWTLYDKNGCNTYNSTFRKIGKEHLYNISKQDIDIVMALLSDISYESSYSWQCILFLEKNKSVNDVCECYRKKLFTKSNIQCNDFDNSNNVSNNNNSNITISNNARLDNVFEFNFNHSFRINDFITVKNACNNILLLGNLINICGKIENKKLDITKLSKTTKCNLNFFKYNKNAIFHVIGNIDICKYFIDLFTILSIDKSQLKFYSNINNGKKLQEKLQEFKDKDMKFDVAIVNPPYKGMEYTKIISEMLPCISGYYVGVHPLTYCMYNQRNEKSSMILKNLMKSYETHIYIKNPLDYFPKEAYIGQVFGVTCIDKTKKSALFLNNIKKNSFDEIQSYADGNEMLQKISELLKSLYETDNVANHLYSIEDSNGKKIKYPRLPKKEINANEIVIQILRATPAQGDFYYKSSKTIVSQTESNTICKYSDFKGEYFIASGSTKYETAKRIREYLKTDFARMTLFVTKPTCEIICGDTTRMIPWFDFNDDMFNGTYKEINERLFNKYIPENIRKNLKNVLAKELTNIYER